MIETMEVWCRQVVTDPVSETDNRRELVTEEYLQGWVRLATVSTQQINSLMYLLSNHISAFPHQPTLMSTAVTTPDVALDLDGGTITQLEYPHLFDVYGSTLPDLNTSDPITGHKWIIRKS